MFQVQPELFNGDLLSAEPMNMRVESASNDPYTCVFVCETNTCRVNHVTQMDTTMDESCILNHFL